MTRLFVASKMTHYINETKQLVLCGSLLVSGSVGEISASELTYEKPSAEEDSIRNGFVNKWSVKTRFKKALTAFHRAFFERFRACVTILIDGTSKDK